MNFKSIVSILFAALLPVGLIAAASPVKTVVLSDFEGTPPTIAKVVASNSSATDDSFSAYSVAADGGSKRLRMTDPGGNVNGIVVTMPGAFTEAGFYMITSDVKVANTAAGPIATFGMAAKVGSPTTARVSDVNAGYILNLSDHPTNGATLGYQTIGAGIEVPAGGTFPKDLTLYFSTDPSGAPGDAHADFAGPHRGSASTLPVASNTSAVFIDNIKRIGPGSFGEERHCWISIGDGITNLNNLENYITQAKANGFNCIDILVRYRANHLYTVNRDFNTYQHNEPHLNGTNAGNDPVQFAIDRGHELGMRVYGAFSCFLVTDGSNSYPSAMPSGSVTYMYNNGSPIPQTTADDSSGLWADPGRADVRAHNIKVLKDLVQNYDLDGIIFDRIRYQGNNFGYNPQALIEMGYNPASPPDPQSVAFERKRQAVITEFLRDAYEAVTDLKPWMIVGTVPIAYVTSLNDTYNRVFQSWPMWSAEPTANRTITFGAQDLIQPQFYRQWDPPAYYSAPGGNRVLMKKAIYGDLASDPMDYGLMPGSNTNVAPLFYILTPLSDATDAANTAKAIADNICDTQSADFPLNGSGIFSAESTFIPNQAFGTKMISRIRSAVTACGSDVMAPAAPLPDFLMKEGYDNTPPLSVFGAGVSSQQYYATINWNTPAAAADGETPARYLVYRSTSPGVKLTYENQIGITQVITGNSFTDGPFPAAGNYYYKIVPVDDYNNKGPATQVGPVSVSSADVIVESRRANDTVTPAPTYVESGGSMLRTSSKSSAPGLVGVGAQFGTTINQTATYRPNLPVAGGYNVYVTMGGTSNNNALVQYTITGTGTPETGQKRLVYTDAALANQWLLLESDVQFAAGTAGTISFKNLDGNSGSKRFVMDAVRFELVSSGVSDWQLY